MNILGIDPGFEGAIAEFSDDEPVAVYDMPVTRIGKKRELDIVGLREILDCYNGSYEKKSEAHCYVEKAQVMPGQGVVSSGKTMKNYGILYGMLSAYCIRTTEVHPRTWKAAIMRDMPKEKGASIVRCRQLFPEFSRQHLTLKKHHGRADALLIAYYGVKQ